MVTKSFLEHIVKKKNFVFPDMIKDWKRPKGDDTTNHSKEVDLFRTGIEILKKNYIDFLEIDP
jgi:hypothetical protein